MYAFGKRHVRSDPQVKPFLQPGGEFEQLFGGVIDVREFYATRKNLDGPLRSLRGRHCNRHCPFPEGGHIIGSVVDISLGKDNQRMRLVLQDLDRLLECLPVVAFAVDAETPKPLHRPLFKRIAHPKNLPSRHEIQRLVHSIRRDV